MSDDKRTNEGIERRKFLQYTSVSTAGLTAVSGCLGREGGDEAIRISYGPAFLMLQPLVALLELDYINENVVPHPIGESIEVDGITVGGSNEIVNSMAADEADGGVVGFTSLSPALQEEALAMDNVSIIWPSMLYGPDTGHSDSYASAAGSGISDWDDIPGTTFAINSVGSGSDIAARLGMENNGIDPVDDVNIVEIPFGDMNAALQEGRIDIGTFLQPFYEEVREDPGVNYLYDYGTPFGNTITFFATFRRDALEEKGESIRMLAENVWETAKFLNDEDNADTVAEIMSEPAGVSESMVKRLFFEHADEEYPAPTGRQIGYYQSHQGWEMDAEFMNPGVRGMVDTGYLEEMIDYSQFITHDYIPDEAANQLPEPLR